MGRKKSKNTSRELMFALWWNSTTPLEPILRRNARKCKERTECAPPAQTFAYFLNFPPPNFFLNLEKVWAGGSPENTLKSVFSETATT